MTLVLALLNFAFLAWVTWRSAKARSLTFFFWVSVLIPFGLPAVYDSIVTPIQTSSEVVSSAILYAIYLNSVIVVAVFFVSRFVLSRSRSWYHCRRCFPAGVSISNGRLLFSKVLKRSGLVSNVTNGAPFAPFSRGESILAGFLRVLLLIQIIGFILIAVDISRATGKPFWQTYDMHWHVVAFEERGPFMMLGTYLSILGASLCTAAWLQRRWLVFAGGVLVTIMICLITGARYLVIPALMPVVFVAIAKKIDYKRVVGLVLVGSVMVLLIYQIQTLRWLNDRRLARLLDLDVTAFTVRRIRESFGGFGGAGEFDLRFGYYFYLEHIPDEMPFANGQTYLRILMMPFPGFLAPGVKPKELTQVLNEFRYGVSSVKGGTDHPLFYGETWANSGPFGAFIGIFWGSIFALLDWWFRRRPAYEQVLLLSPIAAFMVFLARGAVYSSAGFLFVGGAIALFVSWGYRSFTKLAKVPSIPSIGINAGVRVGAGLKTGKVIDRGVSNRTR
ncbi:MAG: hypothetical protein ACP5R4_05055 [Armatimonadota bacterium]